MISDESHLKDLVFTAIANVINDSPDAGRCDLETFATILWRFSSASQLVLDESHRYETYYTVLGRAVTIAIAFRQNCLAAMGGKEETRAATVEYLTKTYGVQALKDLER